jgi:uncharacterized repeat protein (TIGR04052 family)
MLLASAVVLGTGCSPVEPEPVSIRFKGAVADRPFSCSQSYSAVAGQTIEPADFRFYVQDVTLLTADGEEAPVELTPDGLWQTAELALLDFEDRTGRCSGTAEVNTQIRGTVADRGKAWAGLRFTVGVPFAQNHQDRAAAPSPLNLTSMFWSWQSGYKFARIEGTTQAGSAYVLHLGSTGCVKDGAGQVTSCASPNRATVTLSGFDPARGSVVVDLSALLAAADLGAGAECHSSAERPACGAYFQALGLPFKGQGASQSVFRTE